MTKTKKINSKKLTAGKKTTVKKPKQIASIDSETEMWQRLFILSEHWQSDLKFFEDELRFLRSLIDKYFVWLIKDQNIKSTGTLVAKLIKLEKDRINLEQKLNVHIKHLGALIENPFPQDAQANKDEHATLEISIAAFSKDFRQAKKDVFRVTEEILDSEKAKHLLGR